MNRSIFSKLFVVALMIPALVGCDSSGSDSKYSFSINGFENVEGNRYLTKINNDVTTFSFIDKVNIPKSYTWKLYSDFDCKNEILSKTIACNLGTNRTYVIVQNSQETAGFYTVDVYKLHMYEVSFNTNGGSYIPSQQVQEDSLVSPVNDPIKTGYTFNGWDYDFNTPVKSNLRINARWSANTSVVTLDLNGGLISGSSSLSILFGSNYSLPTPTYIGKDFDGWFYGNTLVSISGKWSIEGDCTLVAHWTTSEYYINYDCNGGTMDDLSPQLVLYGDNYYLRQPSRKGYSFLGWYSNGLLFNDGVWDYEHNVNIVAQWEANTYTILFDYSGGQGSVSFLVATYDSLVTLPDASKIGHTFKGWYYGNQLVESGLWSIDDDITLIAHFEANKYNIYLSEFSSIFSEEDMDIYTVRYHEQNSKIVTKTYRYGEKIDIYEPASAYNKYFDGWFSDINLENPFEISKGFTKKETDLYSKWATEATDLSIGVDETHQFPKNSGSQYYFNVPMTGQYKIDISYDASFNSSASSKYLFFFISNIDTSACYLAKDCTGSVSGIFSKTFTFAAGTRIYINEQHSDNYISLDSTWSMKITNIEDLTCFYNESEYPLQMTYGELFNLGVPTIIPEGKTFIGWFTEENGQEQQITDKSGLSITPYCFTSNLSVFPHFE